MAEKNNMRSAEVAADMKADVGQIEFAATTASSRDESTGGELVTLDKGYTDVLAELPKEEGKRILRKVDYRLVPLLSLLYLVAFGT